ncbi:hypothetical protein HC028_11465 [Planosporangium flavigriseum]|uniref:Uncharacterized protein n=1 Tax=Planosporangium flavigriseum TaxID=373681 RepID=A0A8J3PJE5_9ACTN|nr:hypothetical protein [Planosporangium flavigriseum]NJC65116.1 hypothetical protein [Planosporangium flavigriseum]GIG71732.1 hypothetical protein Pfl04_01360 [Planosporangium flavigriseum]
MGRHWLLVVLVVLVVGGSVATAAGLSTAKLRRPARHRARAGRAALPALRSAAVPAPRSAVEDHRPRMTNRPRMTSRPRMTNRPRGEAAECARRLDHNRSTRRYNALADRGHGYVL